MDTWEKLYHDKCRDTEAWAYAYGRLRGMLLADPARASDLKEVEEELQDKLSKS